MSDSPQIIPNSTLIDEKYTVHFFIKKGLHAEAYRVKDQKGDNYFLKLFQNDLLNAAQSGTDENRREAKILKNLHHPNITQYVDDGTWSFNDQQFAYLVLDFISGETLKERVQREYELSLPAVKHIILGVLNGLRYLHSQASPVVHNALSINNVMLDLISKDPVPKIIDFHHACQVGDDIDFRNHEVFNPFYLAPECFENDFSPQSDLFAVGALMYHLLFGLPPWFIDLSEYNDDPATIQHAVKEARQKPLRKPALNEATETANTEYALKIMEKAMKADPDERFESADEMISAIYQDEKIQSFNSAQRGKESLIPSKSTPNDNNQQKGFSQIAGMDDLKETLYNNVIRALSEKELFEQYGLTIPNGMLLYGPPGCGKSFIAEKLAEEAGYNYKEVKPSTIASIYVHGTQEKIGQLFDEARKNAPTILNFEEFDALVPKRDSHAGGHQAGEVNEFLTQLNNCGRESVFVIATTNQPKLIDEAVLRAGRIDKLFYVPPPDFEARKAMLSLLLDERPVDSEVDCALIAKQTANFVAIDLKHIVDEAAREALKAHENIDQGVLGAAIKNTKPSVSSSQLQKYDKIRAELEEDKGATGSSRGRIGF